MQGSVSCLDAIVLISLLAGRSVASSHDISLGQWRLKLSVDWVMSSIGQERMLPGSLADGPRSSLSSDASDSSANNDCVDMGPCILIQPTADDTGSSIR